MSIPLSYKAKSGHALFLGNISIVASEGDLLGSTARIRIGADGVTFLELTSEEDFDWDPDTQVLSGTLTASQVALLKRGQNSVQMSIILADDTPVHGPFGFIEKLPWLPALG